MAEATNPITTASNPRVGREDLRHEATFLLARLRDFESELTDEQARDWYGHVQPSIERLQALASAPSPEAGAGGDLASAIAAEIMGLGWALPEFRGDEEEAEEECDRRHGQVQHAVEAVLARSGKLVASTGSGEETKGGWQPLKTAPQDGEVFLVASVAGIGPTLCSFADGYFRLVSNREKLGGYGIWFWHRLPVLPDEAALRILQTAGEVRHG